MAGLGGAAERVTDRVRSGVVPRPSELHPARTAPLHARAGLAPTRIVASATVPSMADKAKERSSPSGLLRHATFQLAVGMMLVLFAAAVSILLLIEI